MIRLYSLILFLITAASVSYAQYPMAAPVTMDVYDFESVDRQPEFPGGECAMMRYINSERRYPAKAWNDGVEGRVRCSFVVDTDGSVGFVSVLKGVEESLDREAVRIISSMPRWTVGEIDSVAVPVYCVVSIAFRR